MSPRRFRSTPGAAEEIGIDHADPEHLHGSGTNLIDSRTQDRRDGDDFWTITNKEAGTDMPTFDGAMGDTERWDVVTYQRLLAAATPTPEPR